jgi:hypothetical protein
MKTISTNTAVFTFPAMEAVGKAFEEVSASFERFCLTAGGAALSAMMEKDAEEACGLRHCRSESPRGCRWAAPDVSRRDGGNVFGGSNSRWRLAACLEMLIEFRRRLPHHRRPADRRK